MNNKKSNIIMHTTKNGFIFEEETIWLSIDQKTELFDRNKFAISRHIRNIFKEGELERNSVVANFVTTSSDEKLIK